MLLRNGTLAGASGLLTTGGCALGDSQPTIPLGSRTHETEERSRRHNGHAGVLLDCKERLIASDNVTSASLESCGEVLIVVGIVADARELLRADNQVRQHHDVLKPQLRIDAAQQLANFRIREGSHHFIHNRRREHDLEVRIAQEPFDQPARRAGWLDDGADVDVRVEDSAEQWLLGPASRSPRTFTSRALRLEGDRERLFLAHRALLLLLEEFQRVPPCETPHLLQTLDRYQRGQWLALPLDDKLIVTKGHSVEQVTDPLANVDCGDFFHV